jgi:DNA-binding XRE family transcriptional regulator
MMDNLQIIKSPQGEEMIILSRKEYERLRACAGNEDSRDIRRADAIMKRVKAGKTALIPEAVVKAITVKGVHPVRAWREYHGWTGEQLAKKSKLARTTISQIETGTRKGTVAAYKTIAKTLGIGVETLID